MGGMQGETAQQEAGGEASKVEAKSIDEALMIAGKLLSGPAPGGQSPFDAGVQKTMPSPL
jgi:hypothetical protein